MGRGMKLTIAAIVAAAALLAALCWPAPKAPGTFWAADQASLEGEALDSLTAQGALVLPAGACYSSVVLGQLTGDTLSPNCN